MASLREALDILHKDTSIGAGQSFEEYVTRMFLEDCGSTMVNYVDTIVLREKPSSRSGLVIVGGGTLEDLI